MNERDLARYGLYLAFAGVLACTRRRQEARPVEQEASSRPKGSGSAETSTKSPPRDRCPPDTATIPAGRFSFTPTDVTGRRVGPTVEIRMEPFCLDVHEVTVDQYGSCVSCSPPKKRDLPLPGGHPTSPCTWGEAGFGDHPVNCVTYSQAEAFCKNRHARLPTREEFLWAARNGDAASRYPWGDARPSAKLMNGCDPECVRLYAWYSSPDPLYRERDGWPATAPVKSFAGGQSRLGVHDLEGNVSEWTSTKGEPLENKGQVSEQRYVFGSAWISHQLEDIGTSSPLEVHEDRDFVGFRCAADPE